MMVVWSQFTSVTHRVKDHHRSINSIMYSVCTHSHT